MFTLTEDHANEKFGNHSRKYESIKKAHSTTTKFRQLFLFCCVGNIVNLAEITVAPFCLFSSIKNKSSPLFGKQKKMELISSPVTVQQ